ncbi:MAG: DUF4388 domain-containing protein [Candidatus Eisenbacteria bacterium]
MALQGNLRDFSATEILQLVGTQRKTGCLSMEWNTERAVLYTLEGRIISTRNPGMQKDDPLLLFLRKVHRLSAEQYRGILTIQRESNRDLEDLLLNGRYLDADELAGYVERQILDDLTRLVRWEDGSYRFDPHTRWNAPPIVRLSIEGAVIEAARRVDESKRFMTVFRDPYQLLGVRDLPDPNEPLSEEERELFGIIDGQHIVQEIVEAAPLSEYEAYEALFRMLDEKWIEVIGRRDPGLIPAAPAPEETVRGTPQARTLGRELAFAAMVAVTALALRYGAARMDLTMPPPRHDVFAVAQLRDLRFALDLYRREHGSYPGTLDDLIEARWIAAPQKQIPGYRLSYRPQGGGQDYRLDLTR